MRVSSLGGEPRPLTTLANGEISHRFPQVLPGGRAVLFTASTEVDIGAGATLVAVDLASGARTTVHPGGYFGRYVRERPPAVRPGRHPVCAAVRSRRLAATGAAWRLIDSVMADGGQGQRPVRRVVHGHDGLRPRPEHFRGEAAGLDGSERGAGGGARRTGRVAEPGRVAGRPLHRDGHQGRRPPRHLGLRVGAGLAHSPDDRADERGVPRVDAGRHAGSSTVSSPRPPIRPDPAWPGSARTARAPPRCWCAARACSGRARGIRPGPCSPTSPPPRAARTTT